MRELQKTQLLECSSHASHASHSRMIGIDATSSVNNSNNNNLYRNEEADLYELPLQTRIN